MIISTKYRKDIFNEIIQYVKSVNNVNIIIIGRDYNRNIESNNVRTFFTEFRVKDIHKIYNSIDRTELDHTYRDRSKCIDSVAVTPNIIRYAEGSKLLEIDAIFEIDHWLYMIDINLQ